MRKITKMSQSRRSANETVDHPLKNQNGSVIVLTLMVLVIMTVIGIVSSDTIVTENLILRNVGIRKQNVNLVDATLMQGLQEFMQIPDGNPNNFNTNFSTTDWLNDRNRNNPLDNEFLINTIWYETNFTQQCLDANNSRNANTLPLLAMRGENANGNLRYAVVGWEPVDYGAGGSESLVMNPGAPMWRAGRLLAEYVSADALNNDNGFGLLRMELGLKRQW